MAWLIYLYYLPKFDLPLVLQALDFGKEVECVFDRASINFLGIDADNESIVFDGDELSGKAVSG